MTDEKSKDGESDVSPSDETVERAIVDEVPADADETTADETTADETTADDSADDTPAEETTAEDTTATTVDTVAALPGAEFQGSDGLSLRLLVPFALLVVFLASLGVTAFAYLAWYQPDRRVDDAVAAKVLQSASDGAVALLSYTPETLDQDFTNAKTRLTGDFLSYYTQFTQEIVTPAAKQKSVKTSAAVVRSALSKLEPDTAEVLLFINQSTVSKENPDGSFTASSVKVEMTKVDGAWLISSFDPV